jgi:hypothetical protein
MDMKPIDVRFGTDGPNTKAILQRGEYYSHPHRNEMTGWIELAFMGGGEDGDEWISRRFEVERLVLIGDVLIVLPTPSELAETPLCQWLRNERRAQVQHLREMAQDIARTSLRGILEAGIGFNCLDPNLASALAKVDWMKLEWIDSKPGWRVSKPTSQFYVTEAEVERVLGFPIPKKSHA